MLKKVTVSTILRGDDVSLFIDYNNDGTYSFIDPEDIYIHTNKRDTLDKAIMDGVNEYTGRHSSFRIEDLCNSEYTSLIEDKFDEIYCFKGDIHHTCNKNYRMGKEDTIITDGIYTLYSIESDYINVSFTCASYIIILYRESKDNKFYKKLCINTNKTNLDKIKEILNKLTIAKNNLINFK